ncbi:hypothetical protein [Geomonas sp.]|uniref:hypothetical protein n=1 Tax=Geomonas sp. TaxID=2651584 RepID=UPI002B466740|nr:hypothetical protein [Geomonas sp.]HJV37084.1 hypothetical protein [Geomonas sp.]
MRRLRLLLPLLALLAGCESLNDAIVRNWHMDTGISRRTNRQIKEGLERREGTPPVTAPATTAPPFLDEG